MYPEWQRRLILVTRLDGGRTRASTEGVFLENGCFGERATGLEKVVLHGLEPSTSPGPVWLSQVACHHLFALPGCMWAAWCYTDHEKTMKHVGFILFLAHGCVLLQGPWEPASPIGLPATHAVSGVQAGVARQADGAVLRFPPSSS